MKIMEIFSKDKKLKILTVVGLIGIVIIALTTFLPKKTEPIIKETNNEISTDNYVEKLQNDILDLVTSIDGVGKAKVMVTLKNSVEYVYAKEEKQNTDKTNGSLGENQTVQQRDNYEHKTILIEDQNGRKKALVRTTIEPTVKGVVIVCEGGDDVFVQEKVIEAVRTALGIGSNNVCVTKLS